MGERTRVLVRLAASLTVDESVQVEAMDAAAALWQGRGRLSTLDLLAEDIHSEEVAEHNVATMPGESFGAAGGGHVRVSLTADDEDIRRGCERIITMAEGLADKT